MIWQERLEMIFWAERERERGREKEIVLEIKLVGLSG